MDSAVLRQAGQRIARAMNISPVYEDKPFTRTSSTSAELDNKLRSFVSKPAETKQ
jgi:hypothetical protein